MLAAARSRPRRSLAASQRGAVLVQVTVAMLALLGLTAFVFDHGVMWVSRGQAQNAADAGALAGALALAFDDPNDQTGARAKARTVARRNFVWMSAPDVRDSDITFPACPPGATGVAGSCVRVNVFRNQRSGGSPLPTFFGRAIGITQQGVTATATGQVFAGTRTSCVKPWAIPDKWLERRPSTGPWADSSTFERYGSSGGGSGGGGWDWDWEDFVAWLLWLLGLGPPPHGGGGGGGGGSLTVLNPADQYIPPGQSGYAGFMATGDYGRRIVLRDGTTQPALTANRFQAVVINPALGGGTTRYRAAIEGCDPTMIGPGTVLDVESSGMGSTTRQGVETLIQQDPYARWDSLARGGRGAPTGGCMASGTCGMSPRLVPLAAYNVDMFAAGQPSGRSKVVVVKMLGMWLESVSGNDVIGYLTYYPTAAVAGQPVSLESSFLRTATLVR